MSMNGFTADFKKRYPHGAMGGVALMMFSKKYRCRLKSSHTNGNGEKVMTVVCKKKK